jgi:hypothetical protein
VKSTIGYKLAGSWYLSKTSIWFKLALNFLGLLLFVITFIAAANIRSSIIGNWELPLSGNFFTLLLVWLIVLVAVIILHEVIHGLMFFSFGGRPHFGFKLVGKFLPAFYTTSTGTILSRIQYSITTLAPFLILSLLSFLVSVFSVGVIATSAILAIAINVSCSIGDLVMSWKIWRVGSKSLFEDTEDGFNWWLKS